MSESACFDLILVAAIVPLTAWLLLRDLKQAARRQRMRRLLAPHAAAFNALKATVGLALLPAMRQAVIAAADMARSMEKLQATLNSPHAAHLAAQRPTPAPTEES